MNTKLLEDVKKIVDKSSIGKLPERFSGKITLKISIHEGGVRGKRELIENEIND